MKTLITLFTEIMLIGCAARMTNRRWLRSRRLRCFTGKRSQTPTNGSKAVTGIRCPSLKSPACSCVSITLPGVIVNANHDIM
ncbi:MAG: hypothetical protein DME59_12845 [Verrucomicrobia bacterium]|nr:MAG: hypothetical protein DME59_12845 [Verrucomicrobiota bacterium]